MTRAQRKKEGKNTDDGLRDAWDEARALYRPPIRRDAARTALLRVLTLAASSGSSEAHEIRCDAETLLLVVESGGNNAARKRAATAWLAFARRRLRDNETVQDLAQLMRSVGIASVDELPRPFARAFRRAWADERLDVLAEEGPSDRRLAARWLIDVVPDDPLEAYRFARMSLRKGVWRHAIRCARVAEKHKTTTTSESARVVVLAALHREGKPDASLLRDTIGSWTTAVRRGRKVWMFDWRSLAALAIAYGVDDEPLLSSLVGAWDQADPTFAATPLIVAGSATKRSSTTPRTKAKTKAKKR